MTTDKTPTDDARRSGLRLSGGAAGTISGIAVLVIFMAQNTEEVGVTFLFWDFTWPVWLLTLGAAVLGGLVWFMSGVIRRHRRRRERRQQRDRT